MVRDLEFDDAPAGILPGGDCTLGILFDEASVAHDIGGADRREKP